MIRVEMGLPFSEAVGRVRAALVSQGLKVVAEVPTSQILAEAGIVVPPVTQLWYFHPRAIEAVLGLGDEALLLAPVKLVVRALGPRFLVVGPHPREIFQAWSESGGWLEELSGRVDRALTDLGADALLSKV